jgi:iron complex transport system ATP-binding protein
VLPQGSSLQFDYSVREVIRLGRIPHGRRNDDAIIDSLITQCDLDAQADQSYLTLSGGERQRAQLARVLAQLQADERADLSGQLLLLDEPTSALDIPHQERFLTLFRSLRDRGCAIMLVLHDISLLSRCADRLLFLQDGSTLALGPAQELLTADMLSTLYDYPLQVMPLPQGSGIQVARLPREHVH